MKLVNKKCLIFFFFFLLILNICVVSAETNILSMDYSTSGDNFVFRAYIHSTDQIGHVYGRCIQWYADDGIKVASPNIEMVKNPFTGLFYSFSYYSLDKKLTALMFEVRVDGLDGEYLASDYREWSFETNVIPDPGDDDDDTDPVTTGPPDDDDSTDETSSGVPVPTSDLVWHDAVSFKSLYILAFVCLLLVVLIWRRR